MLNIFHISSGFKINIDVNYILYEGFKQVLTSYQMNDFSFILVTVKMFLFLISLKLKNHNFWFN